jgi:hypothetical protein
MEDVEVNEEREGEGGGLAARHTKISLGIARRGSLTKQKRTL